MRITLDLLQQASQTLNPANQRQIQLRGLKIPNIENLGGTNDAYECIDLSDNDLIKLANFPPLKRLKSLLLMNNRISRIAMDAFDPLPQLIAVTLTGNKLEKLVDLEPLTKLKTLERLSLLENPVVKVKHYRPYMINKCSNTLRILDFSRIKDNVLQFIARSFALQSEMNLFLLSSAFVPALAQVFPKGDCSEYFGNVDGFVTVVDLDIGLTSNSTHYCTDAGHKAPCTIVHYAGLETKCLAPGPVDGCHRYVKTTYFPWAAEFLRELNLTGKVDVKNEFVRTGLFSGAYSGLLWADAISVREVRCFAPPAELPVICPCPDEEETNPSTMV